MKRLAYALATMCCVGVTGLVLSKAGWFAVRGVTTSPRHSDCQLKAQDPSFSEAALRWRRCQPNHWRQCMLQR